MSFWCMQTDYIQATFYYLLSGLLDAFDGHAARMLNQGMHTCLYAYIHDGTLRILHIKL